MRKYYESIIHCFQIKISRLKGHSQVWIKTDENCSQDI